MSNINNNRNVLLAALHFPLETTSYCFSCDGPEAGESAGVKNGIVALLLFFSVMAKVILMTQDNTKVILH